MFSSRLRINISKYSESRTAEKELVNDDLTIHSTEFNFIKNQNNQFNLVLKSNGSIYNILDGYKMTSIGNLSDTFVTTYQMIQNNDWFDIQYDTNLTFNDFAVKCSLKNKKSYVDTDSITTQKSFNDNEKFNNDLNKLLQIMMSNQKSQNLIQTING